MNSAPFFGVLLAATVAAATTCPEGYQRGALGGIPLTAPDAEVASCDNIMCTDSWGWGLSDAACEGLAAAGYSCVVGWYGCEPKPTCPLSAREKRCNEEWGYFPCAECVQARGRVWVGEEGYHWASPGTPPPSLWWRHSVHSFEMLPCRLHRFPPAET